MNERTNAALQATLDACGRLGPEHAPLTDTCMALEADSEMLRDALAALVKATETIVQDMGTPAEWHALEDARQALAQAGAGGEDG